jgi:uncharacterized protein YcbK (DUF882 family)
MNSPHFSDAELSCRHCGVNLCTPELVDALEALRAVVGVQIALDCAYRCPAHNLAVGGVPDSEHTRGLAADIKIAGMTTRQMYRAAVQVPAFAAGGIGVAAHQGFIHVDVRSHRARWLYDITGKATPMWDTSLDVAV